MTNQKPNILLLVFEKRSAEPRNSAERCAMMIGARKQFVASPKWLHMDSTEDDHESKAKVFVKQQRLTIGKGYKELDDNLDGLT